MDADSTNGHANTPPRSDVDEILRRKRKAREYKACYPCRQRKVKCDQAVPCKTCVAREHPELCTYHPPAESHPPAKRFSTSSNHVGNGAVSSIHYGDGTVTLSREEWDRMCSKLNTVEKSLADLKSSMRGGSDGSPFSGADQFSPIGNHAFPSKPASYTDEKARHFTMEGIHTRNELTGETVHIGGSSVPALVLALGRGENDRPGVQELLGKSILPIFGLDNESATYPFVDLWSLPHGSLIKVQELCKTLPNDSQCLNFFRHYKDVAHVVYPAIVDVEKFEQDLLLFLINRASMQPNEDGSNGITEQKVYGKNIAWVGLLFAALASGCHMSALPRKERELTSQVFVCCSFECLRVANFLSRATLETIQTLLVLGNVISNNMNAGVAWSLLGLTIRLSQTIGLHRACPASTPLPVKIQRSKTWWGVVWQDSLLSVTYDRASGSTSPDRPAYFPPNTSSGPGNRSYHECMYRLCRLTLEVVRERSAPQTSNESLVRITEHRHEIQQIMAEAADYLKDSRRCRSIRDQLEHWALYLHVSYVTSELCRPAISPSTPEYDVTRTLRKVCIDSLANTVEAFLGLQNVTPFANRSWAAMHRSLSCAVLLGILGEPSRNERARTLINKLITLMSEVTSTLDPQELSMPIKRSIAALRKLTQPQQSTQSNSALDPTIVPKDDDGNGEMAGVQSGGIVDGINGHGFRFDDSPLMGMSPFIVDPDESPYALMDSIMWGGVQRTPSVGS
ncbi:hypothetical protein NA57DRAFT_64544 [Rhizodiscina lignyota]|uniref:Zn(2)-C6 fungal-type domain-containing protein n=1 Tax=Rhizodiscina lignyota TaxID=1504668 RepID=A0A9P4IPH1_9PEZI|nr:hypothetical protein NA57DRAFT_64544 [Rhizodiscina lignyota]